MPVKQYSVPLSSKDDQSEILEKKLDAICRNLLARPLDRRGPFSITDSELKLRAQIPQSGKLRLASN